MDTPRDKQVLKGIMAILSNISFTSRMEGKISRFSARTACNVLPQHIDCFLSIKQTSQIVRNDCTNIQQHVLTKRIINMRKKKEIQIIAKGRGRLMLAAQFPELPLLLEYAFGDHNTHICSGGGLESHPRLTDGTLYRTADNYATMKSARKLLLLLAPDSFSISLSSCYNYTMDYRVGTAQAVRHHHGKGVNADVALCLPPRTGVPYLVINLHWSTANVNLIIDAASTNKDCTVTISKDAKAIVCGDIAPVQRPGRSWKKIELPDHTWDQSRVNAITPMTFLFMDTYITHREVHVESSEDTVVHTDNVMCITRSGQAMTLLYLSFFESETVFRCFNELLYIMTLPSLDSFFRNPSTGKLKDEIILVVDNGPSEQPSSPLVQMLLVRLLKFLKLKKIVQVSFAEYHSKRNFVERVHSIENFALSRHGPFDSHLVHKSSSTGSKEHRENMEAMAKEVQKCLNACQYSKKPLQCFRGIPVENFIFNDDENLKTFLSLTEERKMLTPPSHCNYSPVKNSLFDNLTITWNLDVSFTGSYIEDYNLLRNKREDITLSHVDKYTTCLVSSDAGAETCLVTKIQPLPDYMRWIRTCEMHYMSLSERVKLEFGVWDNTPGLLLPSTTLDLIYKIIQNPPTDIVLLIALVAWVKPNEVSEYFSNKDTEMMSCLDNDILRETWKSHPLYCKHNKNQLVDLCRQNQIPIPYGYDLKHNLVKLIAEKSGSPTPPVAILYSGNLTNVPTTTSKIAKLSVGQLRSILHFHGLPCFGTKDELIIRVCLLKNNQISALFAREEQQLKDLIKIIYDLIHCQRLLDIRSHVVTKRTYPSRENKNCVPLPQHINTAADLCHLFDPLIQFIGIIHDQRSKTVKQSVSIPCDIPSTTDKVDSKDTKNLVCLVGSKIKVKWSVDEVGDSGWKPGWYIAFVEGYDEGDDEIIVSYPCEPGCVYKLAVTPQLEADKIRLVKSPI